MGIATTLALVSIAVVLFIATKRNWIDNHTLQTMANVAGIVALLAAVLVFVIPTSNPTSLPTSTTGVNATLPLVTTTKKPETTPSPATPTAQTPEGPASTLQLATVTADTQGDFLLNGEPKSWMPREYQIPTGMHIGPAFGLTNKDAAANYPDPVTQFNRLEQWGRLTGYAEYYSNGSCSPGNKIFASFVEIHLFMTTAGAVEAFEWEKVYDKDRSDYFETQDGIGQESYQFWTNTDMACDPPAQKRLGSIVFRRQNSFAKVYIIAVKDSINDDEILPEILKLAQFVDLNIVANEP